MRAEFVNPFLLSLMNVMSTMAQVELKPGAPRKKNDDVARGDVSGLIGMVGPQTKGSFSITFDKSLALEVMRRMLGEAPTTINDEVTDMVGEITNMVTGGAKRILGEKGYDFDIEVDGGVDNKTIKACYQAGANVFVAGSYLFKASDLTAQVETLRVALDD